MESERAIQKIIDSTFHNNQTEVKTTNMIRKALSMPSLMVIDIFAVISSLLLAYYLRTMIFQPLFSPLYQEKLLDSTFSNIWWLPLVVVFCLLYENLYSKRLPYWTEVEILIKAATLSIFLTIVWLYLAQVNEEVSRTLIVLTWFGLIFLLPLYRYFGKLLLARIGLWKKQVIIVGSGNAAALIAKALVREKTIGYDIFGIIEMKNNLSNSKHMNQVSNLPLLGSIEEADKIITEAGIDDIIIAISGLPTSRLVKITNRMQRLASNVYLMPDLFGLALNGIELQYFFQEQSLLLQIKNRLKSTYNRLIKQTMDLLLGTFLFFITLPILMLLALAVKLDSKGPAFYVGERIGQGGKLFRCYKFRTMYTDSEKLLASHLKENPQAQIQWEHYQKLTGYDPRVTKVGDFLRRFSLDELPQLINIVKGEMSLVGPRPYLPREKKIMGEWLNDITVAKPGLTGLWQVSGRNNINFGGRLKLDSWYMKNWSPWFDLLIIFRTVKVVINADGAY